MDLVVKIQDEGEAVGVDADQNASQRRDAAREAAGEHISEGDKGNELGMRMTRESGLTASSIPESDLEPGFAVIDGDLPGAGNGHNDTHVDIIAVPCPGADPVKTWTSAPLPDHYFGLEPQNELQRLPTVAKLAGNVILSPVIDRHLPRAGHVWVRQDIRGKVNTARVLLYRHRALTDDMRLEDLARDLLDQVKQVRPGTVSLNLCLPIDSVRLAT